MKAYASPFLDLIRRTPALRHGTVVCVVLALIAAAAEVAVAVSLVPILTSLGVGAGTELESLVSRVPPLTWLAIFAVAAAVRSLVGWRSSLQDERSTQEFTVSLQSRLYRALASAHWDTVRKISPPRLTSALQTQAYDASYGFSSIVQVVSATLLTIAYMISAAAVFPLMIPVLVALLVVMWVINARRSDHVLSLAENYVDAQTELHQKYEDWVSISRISSLGVDVDNLANRFEDGARDAASHAVGYSRSSAATQISYEAAVVTAILVGVPIAWWLETPPALLAFGLVLIIRVLPRAASIHVGYQGIVNAVAPAQAIDSLATQLELDPVAHSGADAPLDWQKLNLTGIRVNDSKREQGRRWILKDVNISLAHGEWLALTGPTGAGKTTLADIMLMLLRPDSGEIRIDGRPLDDDLANSWRNQCAYVPQEVVLFDASIRDNLRLYVPDASDEALQAALRQSAGDFVMTRLPDGLDTRVGPGGRWLSGGERHRIGIARALLSRPGFLVLDEPTAALDTQTQAKLMEALADLERTMSVVLISHRPELLELADRVIDLFDGEIRAAER